MGGHIFDSLFGSSQKAGHRLGVGAEADPLGLPAQRPFEPTSVAGRAQRGAAEAMDHFADDVMHNTSYNEADVQASPMPGRRITESLSGILTESNRTSEYLKVPAIPTNESENIRSIWQLKQNNFSTIFWVEVEGDPLNPLKADRSTVTKRLLGMLRDYCFGLVPFKNWVRLVRRSPRHPSAVHAASPPASPTRPTAAVRAPLP